jgi:hypothetical protein
MSTTMGARPYEFLLSEAPGTLSREEITVLSGQTLTAGTLLGQVTKGAVTATGTATTAGNGDFVAESVDADASAQVGDFALVALSATKALLYAPDGAFLGQYTIGDAYAANGIEFDTEGTWAAGDTAVIAVAIAAGSGSYVAYDDDGTDDGRQTAVGILTADCDATAGDTKAVMIARHAEVYGAKLTGADANGLADLAALHIYARS